MDLRSAFGVYIMVGLVLEGGGMRAGFVAGALMCLMDKGLADFDSAVAVSASVPTLAYFAAGQREEMEKLWRNELSTPRLIRYRNIPATSLSLSTKRPILNIDYLVYDVFSKRYPLNYENFIKAKIKCYFAVTKLPEGKLIFFTKYDNDIYKTIKACLAIPGCYPATVCVGESEYVDGGTVNPLPVSWLLNEKSKRIVAILSKPLHYSVEPLGFLEKAIFWRYFNQYNGILEKIWESATVYDEEVSLLERLSKEDPPRALIIRPDTIPPAKLITRDRKKINLTIDMGYKKVVKLEEEIRRFIKK